MRRTRCLLPLASVILAACASEPPPPAPALRPPAPVSTVVPPSSPPPPPRDDGRLPPVARAERYDVSFVVDPNQPMFSGAERILVQVPAETQYIVLNGRGLSVSSASVQVGRERVKASVAGRLSHGGHDPEELVLTFDRPIHAGDAVLELAWSAPFNDSLAGLYRVNEGGRWYAFTQFEAADARRAFPSFDEPDQKVPFDVHVTAPKGLLAFSNMPEASRADLATAGGGSTTFTFATTPPLPTYLVAFAVGDFDVRQGQTSPVPIRLITTKGKSALGTLALEDAAGNLKELADYFRIAYPYPKLDIVAVPNFAAGAMENAGFITFREESLLLDAARAPLSARMDVSETIAHEEAHQWFGDLVTMDWWDDIWLNEGFATWAAAKVTDLYHPAYHARLSELSYLGDVMATDAMKSARAVRQPVHSTGEVMESFDGITYTKGGAVLGMIEHMIGSDVFQKGVEAYLRDHAWHNASAGDLFSALSKASGRDVGKIAASFVDRPGVPTVSFDVDCKTKPPTLTLAQSPWRLFGDSRAAETTPWIIPTDMRASDEELRVLLPDTTGAYPLPKCPTWIDPNVGGHGYYLYALDEKRWTGFAAVIAGQRESTRILFLSSLWAEVRSGALGPEVLLRLLPAFDAETSRVVIGKEIGLLGELEHGLITPESATAFAAYASARLLPHKRALDAKLARSKTPPTEDDVLTREMLFAALGRIAHDPATLAEANKLTTAWLADPASVDGNLAQVAVGMASKKAGPDRVAALRGAIKSAKSPADKQIAIGALGGFDDPVTLDKGLAVALTEEVATQDTMTPLWTALSRPETREVTMRWVMAHWDAIRARLPVLYAGDVFGIAGNGCTKGEIDESRAFLTQKAPDVEGSARPLAEGLEGAELCRALREKDSGAVDRFFKVKAK